MRLCFPQGHNYPGNATLNIVLMIAFRTVWSPLLSYIRLKTGSALGTAVLHGSINASAVLSMVFLRGGGPMTIGLLGIAGILRVGVPAVVVAFGTRIKTVEFNIG